MTNPLLKPKVLTFSGSDSAGLAGLQMDIKVQHAMGVHTSNVVTAVTAQNNHKVISTNPVSDWVFNDQIESLSDFAFAAVKSGILANEHQITTLAEICISKKLALICDPVFASTSGCEFSNDQLRELYVNILLRHCNLITPNICEAQILTGVEIHSYDDMQIAARVLCDLGAKSVYIKGGHFTPAQSNKDDTVCDYFLSTAFERSFWLTSPKIKTANTRGTGCAFASAVASASALGYSTLDAVVIGKMTINQGFRQSYGLAQKEKGTLDITHFPNQQQDLPVLTQAPPLSLDKPAFPSCIETRKLGLYPVVDSANWLERLLPLGVTTAQLRVKNLTDDQLENEIHRAILIGKKFNCRLFINDHWQLAIKYGAYGVHLGQEDLDTADISAIYDAGLRLGTSTHCHYEVARALAYKPSYIACGPVYETTTKIMPWVPHGIKGLKYWNQLLDYPVVAIGGISKDRIKKVDESQVSGIAMITAITLAENPEETTLSFLQDIG